MNNPNPKLRNALGISALTAFSLVMIGCGGSSSSAPVPINAAPGNVTIAGPTAAVTQHSYIYNLSAVDPENDAITFSTTTAGATISGSVLTYLPTVAASPATLSVIATDSKGAASPAKTFAVNVTPNQAPAFTSSAPTAGQVGHSLNYIPTASDAEGDTVAITTVKTTGAGTYTAGTNGAFTYTPVFADIATPPVFTITASDGHTGTTVQTATLAVSNSFAPVFTSIAPIGAVKVGNAVTYAVTVTDDDSANLTLTMTPGTAGLGSFTAAANGKSGTFTYTPALAQLNTNQSFTLTANDGNGGVSTQTFTLSVAASGAPTFTSIAPIGAVKVGNPLSYAVTLTDDDSANLTLTMVSGTAGLGSFTPGPNGKSGTFTYTPALAQLNTNQAFTLTANDGNGGVATQTFTLSVAPSGAPVFTSIAPIGAVKVGTPLTYSVTVTDPDTTTPLTLTMSPGTAGLGVFTPAVDGRSGTFTYTPALAQLNTNQSFTLTANDGNGGVTTQTFTLSVAPSGAPVFTSIAPIGAIKVGHALSYTVTVTDDDTANITLTMSPGTSGLGAFTAAGDGKSGTFTYTPALAQLSTNQSFTLTANDGKGGVSTQTFTLSVAPSGAPVFTSVSPTAVRGGLALTPNYQVTTTDADENNTTTLSIDPATPLATALPGGTFNATTGVLSYTPTFPDSAVAHTFRILANDGFGGISSQNVSITVTPNHAPIISSPTTGSFTAPAVSSVISYNTFAVFATDPDNDAIRYNVTGTPTFVDNLGGTSGISGTIGIDPVTGIVSFGGNVPSGKTSVTATFNVTATDVLPANPSFQLTSATQTVSLTFNSGNLPPVITTSSLPSLPANHFIPVSQAQAGTGFPLSASDPNSGQDSQLWWKLLPGTQAGLVLQNAVVSGPHAGEFQGANAVLITDGTFNNNTLAGQSLPVKVQVTDPGGLTNVKDLTISIVGDQVPTLNSNVYTETVSGVVAFDPSQVKWDITGGVSAITISDRSRFYPGPTEWIGNSPYGFYTSGESPEPLGDLQATDLAFSNMGPAPTVPDRNQWFGGPITLANDSKPALGWNARTLFRDPEGDGITYDGRDLNVAVPNAFYQNGVTSGSVFVSSPLFPVGQTFTLNGQGGSSNTYPVLSGTQPLDNEYPIVDPMTGSLRWRPILIENVNGLGPLSNKGTSEFGNPDYIFTNPSVWSFTVQAYEQVWNPNTGGFITIPTNKGSQNYTVKVQPNNRPQVGNLWTIDGGHFETINNPVSNPLGDGQISRVVIGGGTNVTSNPGRPSIQEPQSKPYGSSDGGATNNFPGTTGFPYDDANPVTAKWRWLFAHAGGNSGYNKDVQIYDPDRTTVTGHQDTVHATTKPVGITIGTWNLSNYPGAPATWPSPVVDPSSQLIYNPWIGPADGIFQINWGPSRMQYMFSRMAGFQQITLPVAVRDQYQRQNNTGPTVYPIFGTIRIANARDRILMDGNNEFDAPRGSFEGDGGYGNNGDFNIESGEGATYTFQYLPIVGYPESGAETNVTDNSFSSKATHLFDGPTFGQTDGAIYTMPQSGHSSGNFLSTSWITLYSLEQGNNLLHNTNPLNDERDFNQYNYAGANDGSGGNVSTDWRTLSWDLVNQRPIADAQRTASGSWSNHEARAQVIPSNSPYLFTVDNGVNSELDVPGYFGNYPTEQTGTVPQQLRRVNFTQNNRNAGWYYGQRQSEINYVRAIAGRSTSTLDDSTNPDGSGFIDGLLRWTYTWPTIRTNSTAGRTTTGVANVYEIADVLEMAVPNMGGNARWFFTGNGNPEGANSFGRHGLSGMDIVSVPIGVLDGTGINPLSGSGTILGTATAATNVWSFTGFTGAGPGGLIDKAAFHTVTDSIWVPNNAIGVFNLPNASTFTAGVSYTQLPFVGIKGYLNNDGSLPGIMDPRFQYSQGWNKDDRFNSNPGLLDLNSGDRAFFLWLKREPVTTTESWGTYGAAMMSTGPAAATGTFTTLPGFTMGEFLTDTFSQISFATGSIPGVNQAGNAGLTRSGENSGFSTWQRSQWAQLAPAMGPQATNPAQTYPYTVLPFPKSRLVNPTTNVTTSTNLFGNVTNGFNAIGTTVVSTEGGVRDSLVIYGVRDHSLNMDGTANANGAHFGAAGIEPGSPVLAQWANPSATLADPTPLDGARVDKFLLADTGTLPATITNFYSPFRTHIKGFKEVAQLKMNFVVGQNWPSVNPATVQKIPATIEQAWPMYSGQITDPTNTSTGGAVDMGRPVLSPVRLLRIMDYKQNYTSNDRIQTVIDLANSDPSNSTSGFGAQSLSTLPLDLANVFDLNSYNLSGNTYIDRMSTTTLAWQASVNNQVIPSGYIVELYFYGKEGAAAPFSSGAPYLNHTFRLGHIGSQSQVQVLHLPAFKTFSGLSHPFSGNWYFFKVRSFWTQTAPGVRVDMEKAPTTLGIPYAYADFVSAPFLAKGLFGP